MIYANYETCEIQAMFHQFKILILDHVSVSTLYYSFEEGIIETENEIHIQFMNSLDIR